MVSWTPSRTEAAPRAASASELVDAVNALRASYGLAPFIVDPILTAVAERQNNYSISIGQITHYGPDGSRPRDQAIAAGYGGGATVFVSENIVMGTGLTPAEAVGWWTGDDPHLNTMIGSNYRDVGAAVGQSGGAYYYTLLAGYVAGVGSAGSTSPGSELPGPGGPAPVVQAAPQADGSIVHTVEAGQTLWTIAAVYDVELNDLLQLNGLAENAVLHPGDQVVIRPGAAATSTEGTRPSPSPVKLVTPTARRVTPTVSPTPNGEPAPARNPTSWALIVGGAALLLLGVVLGVRRT
jgi:LysM repeat protein